MLIQDLQKLGFSIKEAKTYMILLKLGPAVASTLARHTEIKRTSMYDVLNGLLERNLITSFKQGPYTYFAVDDVDRLKHLEQERLRLAESLTDELKKAQIEKPSIQVHYYKGVEGFRELYEDILRICPDEFLGWVNLERFYEGIDDKRENEWTKERIKKGISLRLLSQNTPLGHEFKSKDSKLNRETRLLPENYPFKTSCLLFDNYITFFDTTDQLTGIRIHNPELFKMQKAIFEMNWAQAV